MIDILASENADEYWSRSDMFNTSVDIAFTQPALDALCRVMEKWVQHFLDQTVTIFPVVKIEEENWQWHVGLDADATGILNDLYEDREVGEDRLAQILCCSSSPPTACSGDAGIRFIWRWRWTVPGLPA